MNCCTLAEVKVVIVLEVRQSWWQRRKKYTSEEENPFENTEKDCYNVLHYFTALQ